MLFQKKCRYPVEGAYKTRGHVLNIITYYIVWYGHILYNGKKLYQNRIKIIEFS